MKESIFDNYKIKINKLIISFLLLSRQFFYYRVCKSFIITSCITFSLILTITGDALSSEAEVTTSSSDHQPSNLYDFLINYQHAPVEFINSFYRLTDVETTAPSVKRVPVFTVTTYTEKDQKQTDSPHNPVTVLPESKKFNNGFSIHDLISLIDHQKARPLSNSFLFDYLLKRYGFVYYQDENDTIKTLTITIGGMLSNLKQSAQQHDPAATLVLAFLEEPFYATSSSSKVNGPQSFFSPWRYLTTIFAAPKSKLSFSERFNKLSGVKEIYYFTRAKTLFSLKQQGYEHQKNHRFTTYELDESGEIIPVVSDDLVPGYAEMQEMQDAIASDRKRSLAPSEKRGISSSLKTLAKVALITGVFCTAMMGASARVTAPPKCSSDGNCQAQSGTPLFARNFFQTLAGNPTDNFRMVEDINLNDADSLPLFPNCSRPFSGSLTTGNFTLNAADSTAPLFGCVRDATFEGNINLCGSGVTPAPVLADQVCSGNTLAVQQSRWCSTLRPVASHIIGNNNRISLIGIPSEHATKGARGAGIIAAEVSGHNNRITLKNAGDLYDTPVADQVSGSNNLFYQQNVNASINADSHFSSNEKMVANHFTGKDNSIKQHRVNVAFAVPDLAEVQNITSSTGEKPHVVASETTIRLSPATETHHSNFSASSTSSDRISGSVTLLSGKLEQKAGYSVNRCPVAAWDLPGVTLDDELRSLCSANKIDTRTRRDWNEAHTKSCKGKVKGHKCVCHLPNEKLHGVVARDQNSEVFLVSRQTYPVDATANEKGLVRLTRLSSEDKPFTVLEPSNETLVAELPVSQLVSNQHLLGLYPGAGKGKSIQLFSAALSDSSTTYHVKTFPVTGDPLSMTEDNVVINNPQNKTIDLYQLNIAKNETGITEDSLGDTPYKSIELSEPENTANIFAATVKNDLLYVAVTNSTNAEQVDIMRYNMVSEQWDPDWQQSETINTKMDYKLHINDQNHARFLHRGEIIRDRRGSSGSIPDGADCFSFDINPEDNGNNDTTVIVVTSSVGGCVLLGTCITGAAVVKCCKKKKKKRYNILV
ncbi:MAG: hypothetical protein OXC48_02080 [Endozoicomonadaceae bacterium]|nr:hypothetical protein [Endozoicomonadaceae bacterium]